MNDHLVLLSGTSATGKSLSLRNIKNPEGVMYLNTEVGKKLPFPSKFKEFTITDPMQIYEAFTKAEEMPEIHTIIVDSLTFLMDQYETQYVLTSDNTMKAWGEYAQYFKILMINYVAKSTKDVIFTAHTLDVRNEKELTMDTLVKVKGSLMNNGIESWFSCVISTKKVPTNQLTEYKETPLRKITEMEEELGFKYVFQTQLTKKTVTDRIRSPLAMWERSETFIDNDVQLVLTRLDEYYK